MNELSQETSPYLLQHAENPVHWKAWNPRALQQAQEQNKLILISIGYSACHWCHVMEHESFEDAEVAQVMNAHFVNIKVDREERPDVDAVYMKALQIMTGQGGWPMNVVALPDGRPVWGGTYFRKNQWINSLEQLQELYQEQPEKMIDYAERLQLGLAQMSLLPEPEQSAKQQSIALLIEKWKKSFDHEFGGLARAPKFMMPSNYAFLMRYAYQNNDVQLQEFVDLTLTRMAWGGLFDTVDGGFSRYSVDMRWHVPHFEKMLYDNGQLVSLYAQAYKRTQNPLYKTVLEKTLNFVSREWLTAEGAFYSALDADSLNAAGHLEEGAFYVWTETELRNLIGGDFDLFAQIFNINQFGHWEHGHYVLIQNQHLEVIAREFNLNETELLTRKSHWEKLLFEQREHRSKPRLDDKCLTSWNAWMLRGYLEAYQALGHETYLETALKNTHFITQKQWSPEGFLWHNYKLGKSSIPGFLEDYAAVISAFICLYQTTFDESWLKQAKQLTDYCLEHFYDEKQGLLSFTSDLSDALVAPHFEIEDNVIPASNSVMAANLLQLSVYFNHPHYSKIAQEMIQKVVGNIDYPSAFSNWLSAFMDMDINQKELAICSQQATEFARKLHAAYLPHVWMAGTQKNSEIPFLKDRFVADKDLFYICKNQSCQLPQNNLTSTFNELTSITN
ncbi:thioredoxin domain-containing protein [Flavobacterium sp. CYK-55]|uniref:thioredoxin domain-containing protein n=1 Tax=Flavobacterium sp. CYK-55 TaxID=2835529 RepID=UPI001BCCE482|nr:thioredoxin domain-containing protein [Flavobacterium sp. CYK-55]MBS7787237.1 thioredoxin domain-containing protein [Flavobacterium sp. CYK-55]